MKTILLLTNFSKASTNAISSFLKGYHQYIGEGYKFILLNAYSQPHRGNAVLVNMEEMLGSFSITDLEAEKKQYLEILGDDKYLFEIESFDGDLIKAIHFISRREKIDLILMGSKGTNVIKELLFSNNTSKVINLSTIPVMIIPDNAVFVKPEKLIFASDMTTIPRKEEFKLMLDRLAFFNTDLLILNVYKGEKPDTKEFESYMNTNLETTNHSFHYVQDSDTAQGISNFVKQNDPSILALVGHNGGLLSSLFQHSILNRLAFKAEQPILILNAETE